MYDTRPSNESFSADDALPPVEPPTPGFILQLFIVPGIIVVIIVMVWLMFNWVARTGNDAQEYVKALRRSNANRWQAAFSLATAIAARDEAGRDLRHDHRLAGELAAILDEELENGSTTQEEPITLRAYLCEALGAFQVSDGRDVLVKAAGKERTDAELEVRLAALRSLALLDENLRGAGDDAPLHAPPVIETLLAASRDPDSRVRGAAAYAMGVVADGAFDERLSALAEDASPDVRYNSATWLAMAGDQRAIPVLVQMLDPEEMETGLSAEKEEASRPYKRALIVANALRATEGLAEKNATADLTPVAAAIQRLRALPLEKQLEIQAEDVLRQLKARQPMAEAAGHP